MKRISASHDEWLGLMNPLSNNSSNYFFYSYNSTRAILYVTMEIGVVLETNSILNSNFLLGDNLERLLGNTSKKSYTT